MYARRDSDRTLGARYHPLAPGNLFLTQGLERVILLELRRAGVLDLAKLRILEVGCGNGLRLRDFVNWGADPTRLVGVDITPERIAQARRLSPNITFVCANADRLEFSNGSFDLVFQFSTFTSLLDYAMKRRVAEEMLRVLANDGCILWYDFRVRGREREHSAPIGRREIRELFAEGTVRLRSMTLAPPLARRLAPYWWTGCLLLEKIPLLRTHWFGVIRKKRPTA